MSSLLESNTTSLQSLLDEVNNLPNAGSGGGSVQSDWNQTDDTAADFIKNKTHGEFAKVILSETQTEFIEMDGSIAAVIPCEEPLKEGDVLEITLGEDFYTSEMVNPGVGAVCFGNMSIFGFEDTGEPFFGMWQDGIILIADFQETSPVTKKLALSAVTIKKIDAKYVTASADFYVSPDYEIDNYIYTDELLTNKANLIDLQNAAKKQNIKVNLSLGGMIVYTMSPLVVKFGIGYYGIIQVINWKSNGYDIAEYVTAEYTG